MNIPVEVQDFNDKVKEQFTDILNRFSPITLSQMDTVTLMNRTDTKFVINISQLPDLLKEVLDHYYVLEIANERISPYSTIYFDTADAKLFEMHHNGKLNRVKIRTRSYINSKIAFLEVKSKNNKGRTSKERVSIGFEDFKGNKLGENTSDFLAARINYPVEDLVPRLQNFFQRVTFVDKQKTERITIDLGLSFEKIGEKNIKTLDELVIIEMKQDAACKDSCFRKHLNELRVTPGSISKYCYGMVLLDDTVKHNQFKRKIRKINKLIHLKNDFT